MFVTCAITNNVVPCLGIHFHGNRLNTKERIFYLFYFIFYLFFYAWLWIGITSIGSLPIRMSNMTNLMKELPSFLLGEERKYISKFVSCGYFSCVFSLHEKHTPMWWIYGPPSMDNNVNLHGGTNHVRSQISMHYIPCHSYHYANEMTFGAILLFLSICLHPTC
mgnify:CR=1 FL=1